MSFYFAGACLLLASLSALPLRWLARFDSKHSPDTQLTPQQNGPVRNSQTSAPPEQTTTHFQPDVGGAVEFSVPAPSGDSVDYYTVAGATANTTTSTTFHHLSDTIHDVQSVYQTACTNANMDLPSTNTAATLVGTNLVGTSELSSIVDSGGKLSSNPMESSLGTITADGLVPNPDALLGVGTIVLPAQPQKVEVINVHDEPVLETVAEEEEEYLDEGDEEEREEAAAAEADVDPVSVPRNPSTDDMVGDGLGNSATTNQPGATTIRVRRKRKKAVTNPSAIEKSVPTTPASSPSQPSSSTEPFT